MSFIDKNASKQRKSPQEMADARAKKDAEEIRSAKALEKAADAYAAQQDADALERADNQHLNDTLPPRKRKPVDRRTEETSKRPRTEEKSEDEGNEDVVKGRGEFDALSHPPSSSRHRFPPSPLSLLSLLLSFLYPTFAGANAGAGRGKPAHTSDKTARKHHPTNADGDDGHANLADFDGGEEGGGPMDVDGDDGDDGATQTRRKGSVRAVYPTFLTVADLLAQNRSAASKTVAKPRQTTPLSVASDDDESLVGTRNEVRI